MEPEHHILARVGPWWLRYVFIAKVEYFLSGKDNVEC